MQSRVACPACERHGQKCYYCAVLCAVQGRLCACFCHEADVKREALWAQETEEQIRRSFKE